MNDMEKVTYEEICKANDLIKPIDVKGKEYAEVKERVKAFRYLYPEGTINTEITTYNKDEIIIVARATDYNGVLLATGHARGKTNKFFSLEDTETSAVGRCLGFLGLGITTSIASAEEVKEAQPEAIFDEPIENISLKDLADKFRELYKPKEQATILERSGLKKAEDLGLIKLQQYIDFKENGKKQTDKGEGNQPGN